MGSDYQAPAISKEGTVSIHAPTWGATKNRAVYLAHRRTVSIHAPTWGATNVCRHSSTRSLCFNPRSHMGSDLSILADAQQIYVSIHAPTWGATWNWLLLVFVRWFQSTLPHGERQEYLTFRVAHTEFQSTLPHGERRYRLYGKIYRYRFQSTLPHGERHITNLIITIISMFQSTLPHGERPKEWSRLLFILVSIHAPTWGATSRALILAAKFSSFNPRSHMGSDINQNKLCAHSVVSIHAPTWGATFSATESKSLPEEFQSTLPHGERRCSVRISRPLA